MKILISTDFYINNLGGVTTSVLALSAGLRAKGHEVKILTLSDHYESYKDGDDYFIRSFPAYYAPDMRISISLNDPLISELIEWNPDIIHVQSEASALQMAIKISKQCGIPFIMTCHTDYAYFVFGEARRYALVKAITILSAFVVYHPAFRILVPSKKALSFPFLKTFKKRLLVLPNGIELSKYQQSLSDCERKELRDSLGITDETKLLVAITRISKEKNIQELISYLPELIKKVPETTLLIVGEGPYEKHLQELTEQLNLNDHVIFAGRVPSDEVWRYFALGDVFVSASLFELHSMSYLEALAQGKPLLCRNDEALDGVLIDNYNGYVYNTKEEFVYCAFQLLTDDKLRKQMGEASLVVAENFSADSFANNALKIYEDVISAWNEASVSTKNADA